MGRQLTDRWILSPVHFLTNSVIPSWFLYSKNQENTPKNKNFQFMPGIFMWAQMYAAAVRTGSCPGSLLINILKILFTLGGKSDFNTQIRFVNLDLFKIKKREFTPIFPWGWSWSRKIIHQIVHVLSEKKIVDLWSEFPSFLRLYLQLSFYFKLKMLYFQNIWKDVEMDFLLFFPFLLLQWDTATLRWSEQHINKICC